MAIVIYTLIEWLENKNPALARKGGVKKQAAWVILINENISRLV